MSNKAESQSAKTVGSNAVLDSLRDRFINRAKISDEVIKKHASKGEYRDAHEAMLRREHWLYAAEMCNQEKLFNSGTEARDL